MTVVDDGDVVAITVAGTGVQGPKGDPGTGGGGGALDAAGLARYLGPTATVAASGYTPLPWAFRDGAALLGLTDPTSPTVLASGVYAVAVVFEYRGGVGVPNATNFATAELDLDNDGADPFVTTTFPLVVDSDLTAQGGVALTAYVPAGGVIQTGLSHAVTGGLDFRIFASIQQLST